MPLSLSHLDHESRIFIQEREQALLQSQETVQVTDLIGNIYMKKVNQPIYDDFVAWFLEGFKSCRELARSYFVQD